MLGLREKIIQWREKKTQTDVVVPIVRNQNMICFMQKLGALFESAVTQTSQKHLFIVCTRSGGMIGVVQ